jgi:Holliday junction DNA helicase RuvA
MITRLTGILTRVLDEEARLQVGPVEYQVLVSEAIRRQIQMRVGQEITLHITEYLESTSGGNRFIPRRIGFLTEDELEFFELFCTVEKIGAKKALKAMARPVKEIADAISRQDARWLSSLPGIGAATAEQIVTTLKRKVARFAVVAAPPTTDPQPTTDAKPRSTGKANRERSQAEDPTTATGLPDGQLIEDVYQALLSLGHNPLEARNRLDTLLSSGKPFRTLPEAITLIYGTKG